MSFFSIYFVFLFFIILLLYYFSGRFKWIVLLFGSLIFYIFPNFIMAVFLLTSILTTYMFALIIGCIDKKYSINNKNISVVRTVCIILPLIINIGILFLFKIFCSVNSQINFFNGSATKIIIPLGISFYTFQALGYLFDVYRKEILPEYNIAKYTLFISYFPQILQGPIEKYSFLMPQFFSKKVFDNNNLLYGFYRISLGIFKKTVVANRLGLFIDPVLNGYNDCSGIMLAVIMVIYFFQLYADFSGYMDIGIGISYCFGIKLSENFVAPFSSKSIAEFWKRWHITLGLWIKNYIYIPLINTVSNIKYFKNGKEKYPVIIALIAVWMFSGLWHGFSFGCVFFGVYFCFFAIMRVVFNKYKFIKEKIGINENSIKCKIFKTVRTFLLLDIGLFVCIKIDSFDMFVKFFDRIINHTFYGKAGTMFSDIFGIEKLCISVIIILAMQFVTMPNFLKIKNTYKLFFIYFMIFIVLICGVFNNTSFIYFKF